MGHGARLRSLGCPKKNCSKLGTTQTTKSRWQFGKMMMNLINIALNISRGSKCYLSAHMKKHFKIWLCSQIWTQYGYKMIQEFDPWTFQWDDLPLKSSLGGIFDLAEVLPSGLNSSDKHHVAKFAPVLATASAKYVHHMILFECSDEARTCWVHLQMYRVVNVDQCGKSCESMKGRCTSSS